MSESPNMAVSPMLTISPSLTISPTLTNTSGSPVHGEATPYYTPPTRLEDIDVDEDADGESDDESDDSVDFNMDADGESDDEQSNNTDACASHAATLQLLPTPSAPIEVERPASSQPTPLRKRRGRPARSSSAPLPPTLRLLKPATANLHPLPGRPSVPSSSRRHSMSSPTVHEESPAHTHGSLSEARMVGQKSKRSQFEEDSSGLDAEDGDGDDEYVDDMMTCSDDDDFEDQLADDDDDEYVDDEVSAPPAKRARCSPSTSTSTATRPRKTRGRRRTSSKAKKATCPECKQTFVRRTDLTRHQKSSSCARVDVWFACDSDQCSSRFRRKDALKRHVHSVHR
ncbi:uncharacterized protein LAESUDRAFT_329530 [Laetiporus sulphureus 93-53]|uniref:C2H2-type domain-containing protein n=1 Tax=Laetiporus sulphureus 93-53 TaxID=1314785 RepID=A0A165CXA2_9APHY|nr:uncharacterized protein LAESUDRAFT_329530 [Laetiporus sulphureus 93-53]KZT03647.1 hypothetical protein LAESUDRAFT_329530 [Laetiporus sulphureus 93-53]